MDELAREYSKGWKAAKEDNHVDSNTSDGFHTFDELYRYRMLYNAALFNHMATHDPFGPDHMDVHKSYMHSDGELCFGGGWFIVMATLPTGQISNHYKVDYWELFQIPEKVKANEYDGHTPFVAANRLEEFLLSGLH